MLTDIIIELWHISRTALAGKDTSRHCRMIYIKNELLLRHSDLVSGMTAKKIWLSIEEAIS